MDRHHEHQFLSAQQAADWVFQGGDRRVAGKLPRISQQVKLGQLNVDLKQVGELPVEVLRYDRSAESSSVQ